MHYHGVVNHDDAKTEHGRSSVDVILDSNLFLCKQKLY